MAEWKKACDACGFDLPKETNRIRIHWNGNRTQTKIELITVGPDGSDVSRFVTVEVIDVHLGMGNDSYVTLKVPACTVEISIEVPVHADTIKILTEPPALVGPVGEDDAAEHAREGSLFVLDTVLHDHEPVARSGDHAMSNAERSWSKERIDALSDDERAVLKAMGKMSAMPGVPLRAALVAKEAGVDVDRMPAIVLSLKRHGLLGSGGASS